MRTLIEYMESHTHSANNFEKKLLLFAVVAILFGTHITNEHDWPTYKMKKDNEEAMRNEAHDEHKRREKAEVEKKKRRDAVRCAMVMYTLYWFYFV